MSVDPLYLSIQGNQPQGFCKTCGPSPRVMGLSTECSSVTVSVPGATYDCVDGACVVNPQGIGQFPDLATCMASGCGAPPPPPAEAGIGGLLMLGLLAGAAYMFLKKK